MIRTKHARLRVPTVMALVGSAIALASLIGSGWGAALAVEVVTVAATIGYYVLGGRDSDLGAAIGARPDERQATIGMRSTALAGNAMSAVAIAGFVVATAFGGNAWPYALVIVVGAVAFVVGSVVYRTGA